MENVNTQNRFSDSYIGSVYTDNSSNDSALAEIETIRSTVRQINKYLKSVDAKDSFGDPLRYRVSLKGREAIQPRVNFHTGRTNSYNVHGDVVGGIRNAGRIDIYIHERRG